jgi:hypothetical protein
MAMASRATYRFEGSATNSETDGAPASGAGPSDLPAGSPSGQEIPHLTETELAVLDELTHLLAKAIRQFRTYPATNPRCADAVAACHRALVSTGERERLQFRVRPRELLVGDTAIGAGTIVEYELARRLHRAHVASLMIESAASPRDLSRFCCELIGLDRSNGTATLAEILTERGIDRIVPLMARSPEVLDVGAPPEHRRDLVMRERERRAALASSGGPLTHLYPPDRGWIRLDPGVAFGTISLTDLAVLVEKPADLAHMLLRLTEGEQGSAIPREDALQQKFSEVATLFAALDPRLAQLMFRKLAKAVLALDVDRRTQLLQRTILPGLLDGRLDGMVLRDFPDEDLAESLCLLMDLETAAPEVLSAALGRLDLPGDRRNAVVPLLERRLQSHSTPALDGPQADGVDRHARRLIHIETGRGASFSEFAAFDLSLDAESTRTIGALRAAIRDTDVIVAQLHCLSNLVRLEPNPTLVAGFLHCAERLLADLERQGRWEDLASWLTRYRQIGESVHETRPDVSEVVASLPSAYFTPERLHRIADLYERDAEARTAVATVVSAVAPGIGAAFVAALERLSSHAEARSLVQLMCDHAAQVAPVLASHIDRCGVTTTRMLIRVLGYAGASYEKVVAASLEHHDEGAVREALRALARIGTRDAAVHVAAHIQHGEAWARPVAEEALWHFPPEHVNEQLRQLLGRREFVRRNPRTAVRLLDRAVRTRTDRLEPVLKALVPFRFRVWNPGLRQVGLRARRLLAP